MKIKLKLKPKVILLIFFLLLSVIAAGLYYGYREQKQTATAAFFYEALNAAQDITSYRYNLEAELYLKNGSIAKTALTGAKDSSGNLHILGKLMDTELEAYQIGTAHYRFRSLDKTWEKQADSPLPDNPLLISFIDPLVNLAFTDTVAVDFKETTKSHGETRHWFQVIPKEGFHIADAFYRDFRCTLAVDPKTATVTDGIITAVSRTEEETAFTLKVHFFDINVPFTVTPPTD